MRICISCMGRPIRHMQSRMRHVTTCRYTEVIISEFGHGQLTVMNRSALRWQFVAAADGAVLDEAWILK